MRARARRPRRANGINGIAGSNRLTSSRSGGSELSNRTIGFEAGLRSILAILRGATGRRRSRPSGFWHIDLGSLGGPMTAPRLEKMNLILR